MSLTHTDTKPWYRQFWPWFLFGLPGIVVIAAFATLYIANRHADDLVVDDYYKEGLAINALLEKRETAQQLGISAKIQVNRRQVDVYLEGPVTNDTLLMTLSHPLESDRDFKLSINEVAPLHYSGVLTAPVAPRWHWTLEQPQQSTWRLDGALHSSDIANGPGN